MIYPGFVGPSYISQSITADNEDLINFYVERMESQGATTEQALYPTPGVEEIDDLGAGPGRAHYTGDAREFAVVGTDFREIFSDGTSTSRGTVAINAYPATISSGGDASGTLFITSGTNGYSYDLQTDTLTQVAALNGIATMGGFLSGFFIALDSATSTFYTSDITDSTTWQTGVNFNQRTTAPDPWIGMEICGQFLWLFGEVTSEVWQATGSNDQPFAPHPAGRLIQRGIDAPFSSDVMGDDLIWLSRNSDGRKAVVRAQGFSPQVISTYPMENAFADYSLTADALGDSYSDRGHNFYLLTFPTEGVTWAWDSETGLWAKRGTWISEDNQYTAWRPIWHAFAFNEHRMLDLSTGTLYQMGNEFATDVDERVIRRLRRAPTMQNEDDRVFYASLQLDVEPGLGAVSGQGENPQVMMRFSNDGGRTWSNERWASAGRLGEYSTRVYWDRLGCGRRRVFEVVMTDPIPWRITNAYLTLAQAAGGR